MRIEYILPFSRKQYQLRSREARGEQSLRFPVGANFVPPVHLNEDIAAIMLLHEFCGTRVLSEQDQCSTGYSRASCLVFWTFQMM
jgi:hypothetical protein